MHVLLADPDKLVLERLAGALGPQQSVDLLALATDAGAAQEHARSIGLDLAVLDIHMEQGLELLRFLATDQAIPHIAILTLLDDDHTRSTCLEAGAHHFFSKAEGLDSLLDLVRTDGGHHG